MRRTLNHCLNGFNLFKLVLTLGLFFSNTMLNLGKLELNFFLAKTLEISVAQMEALNT